MQFGVSLPTIGPLATRENLIRVAQEAETLGFDSCVVSDHIAMPDRVESYYAYGDTDPDVETGVYPYGLDQIRLDGIAALLFVAACTERVQLASAVIILGLRPPIQTAKLWVTLDTLSHGRAILGVGVGWMREEFEALGMPFDHRGARADEMLQIFETLFRDPKPSFDGRFYRFPPLNFNPKPVRGHIPIWIGGITPAAFRRTARFGDAFHPVYLAPATMAEQWRGVQASCETLGRDPATVELTAGLRLRLGEDRQDDEGALCGGADRVADRIGQYARIGVSHLVIDVLTSGGIDAQIELMRRFAADVRPQVD